MQDPPGELIRFDAHSFNGLYWGVVVSTVLFGINIVQAWIYVSTNDDKWPLRVFVAFLFGIDVAQTIVCSMIVHYYFIESFGNWAVFSSISGTMIVEYCLVIVIVFLVQLYFSGRVYLLHRDRAWIPIIIAIGAVGTFVSGIISINNIVNGANDTNTLVTTYMRIPVGVDHGIATVTDIITTAALSWAVSPTRSSFKRTKALLQRLLVYIVTRGLLVTVVQFAFLVVYEARPYGLGWAVLHFCLGKIYVVTMITMLNSRTSLRLEFDNAIDISPSVLMESSFMGRPSRIKVPRDIHLATTNISVAGETTLATKKSNELNSAKLSYSFDRDTTTNHPSTTTLDTSL